MRSRLYRENQATDCQEIEVLRRICCEEKDRARQARIDELIVHASREESYDCESIVDSERSKFLSDAREFHDPESGSSSGAHVPDQPPYFSESQNLAALRFWIAA